MGKNVNLTDMDKNAIISLYKQGINGREIGDTFGISKARVSQIAREAGLGRHDKVLNFSKEDVQIMYDMYIDGSNVEEISSIYGCNRASIYNLFKKYNLALGNDRFRKYEIDDYYFDNIDTPNKAYILGFLWADGHNNTRKGIVEMRLQARDKHILDDISKELKSNRPIYFVKRETDRQQDTYRIYITSRRISDSLLSYGMCANKTYVLQWPKNINDELVPHFLRGFTDGDGHIGKKELSWAGTEMMLNQVRNILFSQFGIDAKIYDTKTEVIKSLRVCKRREIIDVLNWMYKDADLMLERKFLTYQELISL